MCLILYAEQVSLTVFIRHGFIAVFQIIDQVKWGAGLQHFLRTGEKPGLGPTAKNVQYNPAHHKLANNLVLLARKLLKEV